MLHMSQRPEPFSVLTWLGQAALRGLRAVMAVLVTLVLLFEEWGWQPIQAAMSRLARWHRWAQLEAAIRRLPPWAALCAFATPVLLLLPVKLLALWWLGEGAVWPAMALIIGTKLLSTAIVGRLFTLTLPALMQIRWFARVYPRFKAWKDTWMARVRASRAWRVLRVTRRQMSRTWGAISRQF